MKRGIISGQDLMQILMELLHAKCKCVANDFGKYIENKEEEIINGQLLLIKEKCSSMYNLSCFLSFKILLLFCL